MEIILETIDIKCSYEHLTIIESFSMRIMSGSLVCLIGPSGCGKTTILRAIAGFEPVLQGEIKLRDVSVSKPGYMQAPENRKIGMVFQDYALFPHMDVMSNISFGLRKLTSEAKIEKSKQMLELVDLQHLGHRYPHELSGGQQQRVALARTLAPAPDLILMDEPFSNLDADLREKLSLRVRSFLKKNNMTALLVTHEQNDAFSICEEIGILNHGQIVQWDTPFNLYHNPKDRFVANFIGQGTFLTGTLIDQQSIDTEIGPITSNRRYEWPVGTKVELLLRPDDIVPDPSSTLRAHVTKKAFKGAEILYTLKLPTGNEILSLFPSHYNYTVGDEVGIRTELEHVVAFKASLN